MVKSAELASAPTGSAPAVLLLALGQIDTADGTRTHTSRAKVGYPTVRRQRWSAPDADAPREKPDGFEIRLAGEGWSGRHRETQWAR